MRYNKNFKNQEPINNIYDVQLISSYILSLLEKDLSRDIKRVQILLYYIQAKHLYKYNLPIFVDDILAGDTGPFVKNSKDWLENEIYGNDFSDFTFVGYRYDWIGERDKNFIKKVIETFKYISTEELAKKAMEEEPWINTYSNGENTTIPNENIYTFFTDSRINTSRLYGVYKDLDETDIVNILSRDPKPLNINQDQPRDDFDYYIDNRLNSSGLTNLGYHSINDVLGYVCDFLIYKERSVTLKELQVLIFYIQKMFLKLLDKVCFNEFIYKTQDAVSIGTLPDIYKLEADQIDMELANEREFDYPNMERAHIIEMVRIKVLEKKANKYAKEKFLKDELEVMDIVLNKLIQYPGFHILNLVQVEEAWISTNLGETITVSSIYKL